MTCKATMNPHEPVNKKPDEYKGMTPPAKVIPVPEKDEIYELIKKSDIDELLRLVKEGDFSTKNRVLEGLRELKTDDAVDLLVDLLKDDSIAFKAAYLLGEIGTKRATKPLIELLKSKDKVIQGNTIDALAKIKDKRAVKPIIQKLDGEPWIQNRAVEALASFEKRALDDILKEFEASQKPNQLLFYVLEQMKEKPIPRLIKALESDNENLRGNAAYALRSIGTCFDCSEKAEKKLHESIPSLARLLSDESEFVRGNAALALGGLKETGIRDDLVALLGDKDSYPRAMAARALGIIGDEKSADDLMALLKDPSVDVRKNAIIALGKLKAKKSVAPLLRFVKDKEKSIRVAAIRSLSMIGDESAAEGISVALTDEDDDVQIEALHAIKELHYEDIIDKVIVVLGDENAEVRRTAVALLGRIGGEEAFEPLVAALKDTDESVVKSAARAMRELKDESFVDPLIKAIRKNKGYNYEILRTIKEIGTKENLKEAMTKAIKVGEYDLLTGSLLSRMEKVLFASLKDLLGNRSKKFQMNALQTVRDFERKIKDEVLIKKVVSKLTVQDEDIVKRAAEAVRNIGVPAAVPLANIMEKTSAETKALINRVFSDSSGLGILESMEYALKEPTKLAKTVTKESLSLFERLIGVVESTIAEGSKELGKIAKETEAGVRSTAGKQKQKPKE